MSEAKRVKALILAALLLTVFFTDFRIYTSCIVAEKGEFEKFKTCEQLALNIRLSILDR